MILLQPVYIVPLYFVQSGFRTLIKKHKNSNLREFMNNIPNLLIFSGENVRKSDVHFTNSEKIGWQLFTTLPTAAFKKFVSGQLREN